MSAAQFVDDFYSNGSAWSKLCRTRRTCNTIIDDQYAVCRLANPNWRHADR